MESHNQTNEIHIDLINLTIKMMREWEDKWIREIDDSKIDAHMNMNMLTCISRCESEINVLLALIKEIDGLCSYYPTKCFECLSLVRLILEKNLKLENHGIAQREE